MWITASPRSYSCAPASKMPLTVKRRICGIAPSAVVLNSGTNTVTLSLTSTPSHSANSRPRMIWNCPLRRSSSRPTTILSASSDTLGSSAGSTPRIIAPCTCRPCSIASPSTYGAAPTTRGSASARSTAKRQLSTASPAPLTVACDTMPRMRVRSSCSNPFITEMTVISASTPSAMPSIDTAEMKEMKWLRRLARV